VWHLHDRLARDYLPAPLVHAMRLLAAFGPRAIVVNSRATLETLPARARRKSTVAYPGLPSEAFVDREAPDNSAPLVGIIGRISPTKGQREFLNAAANVADVHPGVRFAVVGAALFGEDDYEMHLAELADTLGIGERTDFTGWVDDAPERLRRMTVVVHASPVPEPFGQVVAEAMAAGVPVIAAAAGGVTEILDPDGKAGSGEWIATPTGILVRPGDPQALAAAINEVLTDPSAASARAAAAREDARHRFTIERTADAVWRVWSALVR
jgi:glycosyltransferase involved in cell wall biosynthesis